MRSMNSSLDSFNFREFSEARTRQRKNRRYFIKSTNVKHQNDISSTQCSNNKKKYIESLKKKKKKQKQQEQKRRTIQIYMQPIKVGNTLLKRTQSKRGKTAITHMGQGISSKTGKALSNPYPNCKIFQIQREHDKSKNVLGNTEISKRNMSLEMERMIGTLSEQVSKRQQNKQNLRQYLENSHYNFEVLDKNQPKCKLQNEDLRYHRKVQSSCSGRYSHLKAVRKNLQSNLQERIEQINHPEFLKPEKSLEGKTCNQRQKFQMEQNLESKTHEAEDKEVNQINKINKIIKQKHNAYQCRNSNQDSVLFNPKSIKMKKKVGDRVSKQRPTTFVFQSKDRYFKAALSDYGLFEDLNTNTSLFKIKWSEKESLYDYHLVDKKNKQQKDKGNFTLYNHLKRNYVISNQGLCEIYWAIKSRVGEKSHGRSWKTLNFLPLMYDLDEPQQLSRFRKSFTEQNSKKKWIIKEKYGSKKRPHEIDDESEMVNLLSTPQRYRNKIAQIKVEKRWMMDHDKIQQSIQRINSSSFLKKQERQIFIQNRIKLFSEPLFRHSFSLKQLVLIIPPQTYIYGTFYLEVDPDSDAKQKNTYMQDRNLRKESLRNENNMAKNTSEKLKRKSHDQFYLESHLNEILLNLGEDQSKIRKIRQKITKGLSQVLSINEKSLEVIGGCFSLIEFRIVLDESLNPSIVQAANFSPRFSEKQSEEFTFLRNMADQTVQLVLGDSVQAESQRNMTKRNSYGIQLLRSTRYTQVEIQSGKWRPLSGGHDSVQEEHITSNWQNPLKQVIPI